MRLMISTHILGKLSHHQDHNLLTKGALRQLAYDAYLAYVTSTAFDMPMTLNMRMPYLTHNLGSFRSSLLLKTQHQDHRSFSAKTCWKNRLRLVLGSQTKTAYNTGRLLRHIICDTHLRHTRHMDYHTRHLRHTTHTYRRATCYQPTQRLRKSSYEAGIFRNRTEDEHTI